MPLDIQGVTYWTATETARSLGLTRQTIWRWGQTGSIPPGRRDRRGRHLFTTGEVEAIRDYAHELRPANGEAPNQLRLFNGPDSR